jgi:hypothetical protein
VPPTRPGVPLPDGFNIDQIVADLSEVDGMVAVVLGGSWASGRQRPDSDVDLGLYYRADHPLDVEGVRTIAQRYNDIPEPVVTDLGIWGQWVNGGSWLTIKGQRLDFIYRDLDFMTSTIDDVLAATGRSRSDFWQSAPYGFHPQIYCAEARCMYPLWDPEGIVATLREKVAVYPDIVKRRAVSGWLWGAQFTAANAKYAPERGEAYLVAGYLTRAATEMIQALYALNETFFTNDKHVYRDIAEFKLAPRDFMARVDALMGGDNSPGDLRRRIDAAQQLHAEMMALTGDLYTDRTWTRTAPK